MQAKHSVFWERSDFVVSGIFRWIRDTGVIIEEDMDEASTRGYQHGPSFWGPPAIYNHKFETVAEKFEDLFLAVIFFQITFTTDMSIYCPYFRRLISILMK